MRDLAQWAALPLELVAELPPGARDELVELVNAGDPWIVQGRK